MEKCKEITTMTTRLQDRPLFMTIHGGLQEGHMIYMEGKVPEDATLFIINLQMGSHQRPPADTALHIAVRLECKGYIVCNAKIQGRWGREERYRSGPFVRGQTFNIGIIVASGEFQVISDDKPFIMFKQRICGEVDTLLLFGQYQLQCLSLLQIMNVPCVRSIPEKIRVGSVIFIRATVKPHGNMFVVNLCESKTGDIALHLNPRMQGKKLVRNALLRQAWGQEELAASEFPFRPGKEFEVRVTCEVDSYHVTINGNHSFQFKHRLLPISRVDQIALNGDIMLPHVETGKPWHVCHSCCLAWRAPLLMCLLLALGPMGATGREEGTCGSCGPQGLQCSVSDNDCDRPLPFIKAPPGMATDLRVETTASKGKLWLQVHWSLPLDASVHAITHLLLEVLYSDLELHCVLFTLAHPLSSQRAPDGGKWRFSYDCISVEPQDLVIISVYTLPLGTPPLSTRFQVQDCHEETMIRLAPQHCQGPHLSVISYVAEDGEVVIDYNSSFLSKRHAAFPCLSRGTACLTQRLVPHGFVIATGSSGQFHLRGLPALPCLCVQVFPVDVSHQRAQVCPFFQKRWMHVEGNVQVLPGIITVQIKVLPQQCSLRVWLCLWVLDQGEAGRPVSGTQREALIGNWTLEYSLNKALVQEAAGNTLCVKVWSDGKFLMEDKVFCPSEKWSGVADAVLGGGVSLFFLVLLLLLVRYLKSNRAVDTGEQGQLLMLHAADSHPMREEVLSLASRLIEHLGRTPLLDLWDHRGMATLGLHGWLLHHRAALDRVGGWIILMMSPIAVTKLRRDHCESKSGNALAQSDMFSVAVPSIMSDQLDDTWSGRYVLVFPPNTRNCQDLPTALHGRPVFSLWQDFEALCNHLSARSKTKLCVTGHKRLKSIWL